MNTFPFLDLFPELLHSIVRFLDPVERARCRRVCRYFYQADRDFRLPRTMPTNVPQQLALHWLTLCDTPLFHLFDRAASDWEVEKPYPEMVFCTLVLHIDYIIYISVREPSGDLGFCSIYPRCSAQYLHASSFLKEGVTLAAWLDACPTKLTSLAPR